MFRVNQFDQITYIYLVLSLIKFKLTMFNPTWITQFTMTFFERMNFTKFIIVFHYNT